MYLFNILCWHVLDVCKCITILYECFDLQMCTVVNRFIDSMALYLRQ